MSHGMPAAVPEGGRGLAWWATTQAMSTQGASAANPALTAPHGRRQERTGALHIQQVRLAVVLLAKGGGPGGQLFLRQQVRGEQENKG